MSPSTVVHFVVESTPSYCTVDHHWRTRMFEALIPSALVQPFMTWVPRLRHPRSRPKRAKLRQAIRIRAFQRYGYAGLTAFAEALREFGPETRIWLEGGTLLGAFRNTRFIPWDEDIDLGVMEQECTPELLRHLDAKGFPLLHKFTIRSTDPTLDGFVAEYSFLFRGWVKLDLLVFKNFPNDTMQYFAFDAEEGMSWEETEQRLKGLRAHTRVFPAFELSRMDFGGVPWHVPSNTAEHLVLIYGADFMTPRSYTYAERPRDDEILLGHETLGIRSHC
jgi:hypothetical protein